jgi:hypothetical protein
MLGADVGDCLCRALMLWGGNRKRLCFETFKYMRSSSAV